MNIMKSVLSILVLFFAVSTISCSKDDEVVTPNPTPELPISSPDFEGVKLIVSYQDSKDIDMYEPHSARIDVLKGAISGSLFATNTRYDVTNALFYGDGYVQFLNTGLDLHGTHFHTSAPKIAISHKITLPTAPYWRSFYCVIFDKASGSVVLANAENVIEKSELTVLKNVSNPHNGRIIPIDGALVVTDSDVKDVNKDGNIIKIVDFDNNTLHTFGNMGKLVAHGHNSPNYIACAVMASEKGLFTFKFINDVLQHDTILYPANFNNQPMDELINKKDLKQSTVFGIKLNKGIYDINTVEGNITQLANIDNIVKVHFSPDQKLCYVFTSNNKLLVYNSSNFSKVNERQLASDIDIKNSTIAISKQYIYLAIKSQKNILRFDTKKLDQYASITVKYSVSSIGLAGNTNEVEINNH